MGGMLLRLPAHHWPREGVDLLRPLVYDIHDWMHFNCHNYAAARYILYLLHHPVDEEIRTQHKNTWNAPATDPSTSVADFSAALLNDFRLQCRTILPDCEHL